MPGGKPHYRIKLSDALSAHNSALATGGLAGILDLERVEAAIARPYAGYHRLIANKIAALVHGVVQNHGFTDGNKRTAVLLMGLLLNKSGYRLTECADDDLNDAVEEMVVAIADTRMSFDDLVDWFKLRIRRLP